MKKEFNISIAEFSGKPMRDFLIGCRDALKETGESLVTEEDNERWEYLKHYSDKAIEMLKEYEEKNSCKHIDYVFEIFARYEGEKEYTVFHEPCEFDYDDQLCWQTDWFEGQQDIIYNRLAPADDIYEFYFKHVGDNNESKSEESTETN